MIVSLGVLRPDNWTPFAIGMAATVAVAAALNYFVPRLYPWGGEEGWPPGDGPAAEYLA